MSIQIKAWDIAHFAEPAVENIQWKEDIWIIKEVISGALVHNVQEKVLILKIKVIIICAVQDRAMRGRETVATYF